MSVLTQAKTRTCMKWGKDELRLKHSANFLFSVEANTPKLIFNCMCQTVQKGKE